MITLLADSGLSRAAEAHYVAAVQAATPSVAATTATATAADDKDGTSTAVVPSLLFRGAVLIPAVYDNQQDIISIRQTLHQRIAKLMQDACVHGNATLDHLDEFTLSPTFYLVYQVTLPYLHILVIKHNLQYETYHLTSALLLPSPLSLHRATTTAFFSNNYDVLTPVLIRYSLLMRHYTIYPYHATYPLMMYFRTYYRTRQLVNLWAILQIETLTLV